MEPKATPTPGRVWEAYHIHGSGLDASFYGYLVSDAADPHRPLAIVLPPLGSAKGEALDFARRVAERTELIDRGMTANTMVRDLRPFCRTDSMLPCPADLYRLRLSYLGGDFDTFPFFPFCRFRLARMIAELVRQTWTAKERKEMPEVTVELTEAGGGSSEAVQIAIPLSEIPL